MTKTKTTKRALFASVLSLLLCVSMLIGSTFAWFTDTATTGVNNIQAGTLDIALEMLVDGEWVNAEGKTLNFIKADNAGNEEVLWEPGCTYKLPDLRIVNNGDLHLKYMLTITGIDGDAKLNEAIEWTYGDYGTVGTEYVALAPKATSETITIQGHMKEEAGNEYQGLSIEGISITVFATQLNVENDSFGPDYDKDAPTLFMIGETRYETLAAAIAAAKDGETIAFSGVITLPTDNSLKNRTLTFAAIDESISVIDMKNVATGQSTTGADLTFKGVEVIFGTENYRGIQHAAKIAYEDCTIYGKQFMYATTTFTNCEFINYTDYCVWTYGADATFTNCTFTTGGKAILVYNEGTTDDTVTVNGCTFDSNGQIATDKAAVETGINTNNADAAANSKHTIIITNCTADGFAANNSTSPLWGNKNSMDADHLTVTVDGDDQPIYAYVTIGSADELVAFANAANDNTLYQGVDVSNNAKAYVTLTADIDMSNVKGWMPISKLYAKDNEHFNGTFDGKGHTISGLTFGSYNGQASNVFGEGEDFNAGNYYAFGLFGVVEDGAVIKNFTLSDIYFGCYTSDGAAVVGDTKGNVTFENITIQNALIVQARQVGGIVGQITGEGTVTFKNCKVNDSAILAIARNEGVLYGYAPDTVTVSIENCSTTGSVITNTVNTDGTWSGGIQHIYSDWASYVASVNRSTALADTNFVSATID